MAKAYAAQILENTVEVLDKGLRNLKNPDLLQYYSDVKRVSGPQLKTLVEESVAFREENSLPSVSRTATAAQIERPLGPAAFRRKLQEIGFELESSEDLVSAESPSQVPSLNDISSFLINQEAKGLTLDAAALQAAVEALDQVSSLSAVPKETLHITVTETPSPLVDEVSRVSSAMTGLYAYIRAVLRL
jgi:hypothetical protein